MKLGLITFHRAVNYGAVLQTYALQNALERLGAQVDIIDYRCAYIERQYNPFGIKPGQSFLDWLVNFAYMLAYFPFRLIRRRRFLHFVDRYLRLTGQKYTRSDQLATLSGAYDGFITGSDQVWSAMCTGFDSAYFLNFTEDVKKNSYAASFGADSVPSELAAAIGTALRSFSGLSVREETGRDIVRALTGRDCAVSLDPTFLIERRQWERLAIAPYRNKDYVLLFVMQYNREILTFAERLAEKEGCDLIYITESMHYRVKGHYRMAVSPEQWLGYFANARAVVTNSFHGTAFSIQFQRDFFVQLQPPPATANARLTQMIELFSLRHRLIDGDRPADFVQPVDWESVGQVLAREREKSIGYLKKIVGEKHE